MAIDEQDYRRIQFWCRDQFRPDGGGGASCGYHALRNGILLGKAVLNAPQCNQYLTDLYSPDHMNAFFGTQWSPWRSFILEQRDQAAQEGGDWLEGVEILQLIDKEQHSEERSTILRDAGFIITTYGDMLGDMEFTHAKQKSLNAGPGARTDLNDYLTPEFIKLRDDMRDPRKQAVIGVVLVYVSQAGAGSSQSDDMVSLNEANTNGHWFTLVVCRLGGQTQYLLADSGANHKRLRDKKVNEIIRHFEGDDAPARPKGSMAFTSAGADGSSVQVQPDMCRVASVNPLLAQGQAKTTAVGMSLTAKVASTAVAGLAIYGGYSLYKRYTASSERENAAIQLSDQTVAYEDFLI